MNPDGSTIQNLRLKWLSHFDLIEKGWFPQCLKSQCLSFSPVEFAIFLGVFPFWDRPIYLNHPESKRCLSGRQWKLCQGVSKKGSWKRWKWWYMTSWHSMKSLWIKTTCTTSLYGVKWLALSPRRLHSSFFFKIPSLIPVDPHVSNRSQPQAWQNLTEACT